MSKQRSRGFFRQPMFNLPLGKRTLAPSRRAVLALVGLGAGVGFLVRLRAYLFGLLITVGWKMESRFGPGGRGVEEQQAAFEELRQAVAGQKSGASPSVVMASIPGPPQGDQLGESSPFRAQLEGAVCALTGAGVIADAYRGLFSADDTIGIKAGTGAWGLVVALIEGLIDAGFEPSKIVVFDRPSGPKWQAPQEDQLTRQGVRFDFKGLSDDSYRIGTIEFRIARGLAGCTALVNMGAAHTHHQMGMTGALKNHMGSIKRPEKLHVSFDYSCAMMNYLPPIRERTRLVVVDALTPSLKGHPDFPVERYNWPASRLLVGRDPVAVDSVILDMLRDGAQQYGLTPDFSFAEQTLTNASALGLGISDTSRINVIRT